MPSTWRDARSAYSLGPDLDDPRDNILAGAAYLRMMYDRFGHAGLVAAYNAGPARYAASLAGASLPAETRDYLSRVAGTPPSPWSSASNDRVRPATPIERVAMKRRPVTGDRIFAVRGQ